MENNVLSLIRKLSYSSFLLFFSCVFQNFDENPIILLISFDGFRYDYMEKVETQSFDYLKKNGVKSKSLKPIFPTFTFPNHYSIATGCYSDNHGILGNTFYDFQRDAFYSYKDSKSVQDGSWYGCEPIWVTAEKNNIKTATYFWIGSEAKINGYRPSIYKNYKSGVNPFDKVDEVIKWLNYEQEIMPRLITLYFDEPDHSAHIYGPESFQTLNQIELADSILGYLINAINDLTISDRINIIITSDHGMIEVSEDRLIKIDNYFQNENYDIYDKGPMVQLYKKNNEIVDQPFPFIPNVTSYSKNDLPEKFHFNTYNTGDIVLLADSKWLMYSDKDISPFSLTMKGMHGYDPSNINMHGIFYAYGPYFKENLLIDSFELIHIYPLICKILSIQPFSDIDGDMTVLNSILK